MKITMSIYEIIVTFTKWFANGTVNNSMCYSNLTIVNMYTYYRKLVYKIIVNGSGYRITYFVASY